jgi:hypothetical protein
MKVKTDFTGNSIFSNNLLIKLSNELGKVSWQSEFDITITNLFDGIHYEITNGDASFYDINKIEDLVREIEKQQ